MIDKLNEANESRKKKTQGSRESENGNFEVDMNIEKVNNVK